MLDFLIKLFSNRIDNTSSLYTFDFYISNNSELDYIKDLDVSNIINDEGKDISEIELTIGNKYKFDVAWTILRKYGFYITCEDFTELYDNTKQKRFYILEIDSTEKNSDNFFIKNYNDINSIKSFIISISDDNLQDKSFIYSEGKYLKIILRFSFNILLRDKAILKENLILEFLNEYQNSSKEIKIIFKNELINFLKNINDSEKLKYLYYNFEDFYKKRIIGYEFYISGHSFNKLKTELDNSILEFHKNIRSVINDSQTKLIAIPASILLVFTNLDTDNIIQDKNLFILIASIIFALLIHFFIRNQITALSIINTNTGNYIKLFELKNEQSDLGVFLNDFSSSIKKELSTQRFRLIFIDIINWGVPFGLLIYIVYLIYQLIKEISF